MQTRTPAEIKELWLTNAQLAIALAETEEHRKSLLSTLYDMAHLDGRIHGLDRMATRPVPTLVSA